MKNIKFIIMLLILLGGLVALYLFTPSKDSASPRPGVAQSDEGRDHISNNTKISYKNTIPTSGNHSIQPAPWGVSSVQLNDEGLVHNMEHGGIVISYRPDTDSEIVNKLEKLFSKPYSNPAFRPIKAVVMPRAGQEAPMITASWKRLKEFQKYNELEIIDYYNSNIGNSPEPNAN